METQMAIDNSRKRSRDCDDEFKLYDPNPLALRKKTRLTPSPFENANAPTCDFAPPAFAPTWSQSADSSAASTPASMDMEMDIDRFHAATEPAHPAGPSLPPQPAQQTQGQGTIISGWNQVRRMELCVQGYPPALQLELSRWARAQA